MSVVLFVEDEVSLRVALRFQLSSLGELIEARDREDAFKRIETISRQGKTIDLAIVDLQLLSPGLEPDAGFEVVDRLAESFPKASVIIFTIRNDKAAWQRSQQLSCVRYFFTKPASSDAVIVAARTCLEPRKRPLFIGTLEGEQP